MSYAGAHVQAFNEDYLGTALEEFDVPGPFASGFYSSPSQIVMRRRGLECLDEFLGHNGVSVFHSGTESMDEQRLYLSTDVETLADIWGPLWKTIQNSEPSQIQAYNIGNGRIVPWSLHRND